MTLARRPCVLIIGAGFGGLRVARALRDAPVEVLVVDRHNHHAFQPLFYEVATAGLDPGDIAQPVRSILRDMPNATFRIGEAVDLDLDGRGVILSDGARLDYDYLVLAAGSGTAYFGVDSARRFAHPLKTLAEALALRNRLLGNYEQATLEADAVRRRILTSIVVVGGGPTGVEMAGALAELQHHVLARDYPALLTEAPPVMLLEAAEDLLGSMPEKLRRRTRHHLAALGVDVRLHAPVAGVTGEEVTLRSGEVIPSANVIWVAGVRAVSLAARTGQPLDPSGRTPVSPTLQVPGHPEVLAIGDIASFAGSDGRPLPMLAPVALQQADLAAHNIRALMTGQALKEFEYKDRGTMATIGRSRAVAHVFGQQLDGVLAWWLWLALHLYQIIGLRNRTLVLVNWIWNYLTYDRSHRVVVRPAEEDRGE